MTTIIIKHGNLEQTNFSTTSELLDYLIDIDQEYGVLHPLKNTEISLEQATRFKKALDVDKSKMLNI